MILATAELEEKFTRELLARLPGSIRIGAHDFRVVPVRGNAATSANLRGEFSSQCQEIRIKADMPTRYEAVEVLMHEISHGMWFVGDIEDDPEEEHAVAMFGQVMMGLFRDNPWLLEWIKSAKL